MANAEHYMLPLEVLADELAARYDSSVSDEEAKAAERKAKRKAKKDREEARYAFDSSFDTSIRNYGQVVLPQTLEDFRRGRVTTITPPVEITSGASGELTFQFWALSIATQFEEDRDYSGRQNYKYIYAGPKGEASPEIIFGLERDSTRYNTRHGIEYSNHTRQYGLGGKSNATHDEVINSSGIAHAINVGLIDKKA